VKRFLRRVVPLTQAATIRIEIAACRSPDQAEW